MENSDRFPLHWPTGWPRRAGAPQRSQFKTSFTLARDCLMREVTLLGGREAILSTNIPLRLDGLPKADFKVPTDAGAAIYFTRKGTPTVLACDRFGSVADNIQAMRKTVEALRGIERWGASDMLERAFQGFQQIEGPTLKTAWQVLDVTEATPRDRVTARYMALAKIHHPDAGGSALKMAEINAAYDTIKAAWNKTP